LVALAKLNHEGFEKLIIDLRGNRGGFMAPAIRMANEFLPKDRLIVYTQGRKSPRQEYSSDGRGSYQNIPLIVLVDETSASASEIFSAAIQDNDRGTIVGRRTFGKGLVQEPIQFPDGSLLRLTIARYYSASGRCLQKPYVQGEGNDYQMDLVKRAQNGEYISQDSIHFKGKKYKTRLGRIVYSEGGVMPDYFVPEDTTGVTSYYIQAMNQGLLAKYSFIYVDSNRETLHKHENWEETVKYLKKSDLPYKFAAYAAKNGLKQRNNLLRKSYDLIQSTLITLILEDYYDPETRIMYNNLTDPNIKQANKLFAEEKSFPHAPENPTPAKAKKHE
jgi:carboxyl-terminal processing protease